MTAPRVTCVLAVYNGAEFLRESIDSVLAQTSPVFELIVVDDGSRDGTAAVLDGYGERLRRFAQANAGPAAARNLGIGEARGDFIAFQDADDRWDVTKIERHLARFAARPELGISSGHVRNFWIPELSGEAGHFHQLSERPIPGYGTPSILVRRSVFDSVGLFDTALPLGSDTDWFLRAVESGVVAEMLPDVVLHRRWHRRNISRGTRPTLAWVVKASLDRRRANRGPVKPVTLPT